MSQLSKLLNERNAEGLSALEVGRRAEARGFKLAPATATALMGGRHAREPQHETLEAVASVLPVTVAEMRVALGMPADPGQPWSPPSEARHLTPDERAALGQLIKVMVSSRDAAGGSSDAGNAEAEKTAGAAAPTPLMSARQAREARHQMSARQAREARHQRMLEQAQTGEVAAYDGIPDRDGGGGAVES